MDKQNGRSEMHTKTWLVSSILFVSLDQSVIQLEAHPSHCVHRFVWRKLVLSPIFLSLTAKWVEQCHFVTTLPYRGVCFSLFLLSCLSSPSLSCSLLSFSLTGGSRMCLMNHMMNVELWTQEWPLSLNLKQKSAPFIHAFYYSFLPLEYINYTRKTDEETWGYYFTSSSLTLTLSPGVWCSHHISSLSRCNGRFSFLLLLLHRAHKKGKASLFAK